eukprot:4099096-Pleurochrysis_carterae.AAC.2
MSLAQSDLASRSDSFERNVAFLEREKVLQKAASKREIMYEQRLSEERCEVLDRRGLASARLAHQQHLSRAGREGAEGRHAGEGRARQAGAGRG